MNLTTITRAFSVGWQRYRTTISVIALICVVGVAGYLCLLNAGKHRGTGLLGSASASTQLAAAHHGVMASYSVLPIIGPIGKDASASEYVTAHAFEQALQEIRSAKPDYVILAIKSPGGSIPEMDRIIAAIEDAKEIKFIAVVQEAYSAAAVIAMSCPQIFMSENGCIGAAVPYHLGPSGTPENIEEKFQSVIRARFRSAVRMGGHSPLFVRGMSETEIELSVIEQDGKPTIIETTDNLSGHIIKHRGQILTLTSDEALLCGLSSGTIESNDELRQHLGYDSGYWFPIYLDIGIKYIYFEAGSDRREQIQQITERLWLLNFCVETLNTAEQSALREQNQKLTDADSRFRQVRKAGWAISTPDNYRPLLNALNAEHERQRSSIINDCKSALAYDERIKNNSTVEADRLHTYLNVISAIRCDPRTVRWLSAVSLTPPPTTQPRTNTQSGPWDNYPVIGYASPLPMTTPPKPAATTQP